MSLQLLDTTAILQVESRAVAHGIQHLLAPFIVAPRTSAEAAIRLALVDGDSGGGGNAPPKHLAYRDSEVIAQTASWAAAVGTLITTLNRQVIDDFTGFAAHCGVVSMEGRAVAFPAESGGGKTTLTAACLRAGFDYVSDESLCIDLASTQVVSYPKPMGLSRWSRRTLGIDDAVLAFPPDGIEGMAAPGDLGASIAADPIELAHVVRANYGAGTLALTEAPANDAMAALLEYSFNHFKYGVGAFVLAAELAKRVEVWRLDYDDPIAAAQLLQERFARSPRV